MTTFRVERVCLNPVHCDPTAWMSLGADLHSSDDLSEHLQSPGDDNSTIHSAAVLLSPIVLMLFAILETFIPLSISLFLCMYII